MAGSSAPLDREVLDQLRFRSWSHPLVATATFDWSADTVRSLVLRLDADQYPDCVQSATLTVRWFENDEYTFHYREQHGANLGASWQCRWDRHPNPHAGYEHFHEPPDAGHASVVDDPIDAPHPSAMLSRTFANVEERIAALWE